MASFLIYELNLNGIYTNLISFLLKRDKYFGLIIFIAKIKIELIYLERS